MLKLKLPEKLRRRTGRETAMKKPGLLTTTSTLPLFEGVSTPRFVLDLAGRLIKMVFSNRLGIYFDSYRSSLVDKI